MSETIDIVIKSNIPRVNDEAKGLRTQMKELKKELENCQVGSEQYANTLQRLATVSHEYRDQQELIKYSAADVGTALDNLTRVGSGLASGLSAVSAITASVSGNNEQLQKTFVRLQQAMALANGMKGLEGLTKKFPQLVTSIRALITANKGATTSTQALTTAEAGMTVATKASTVALKGLKTALISTGVGVLVVGLGELIAHLEDVAKWLGIGKKETIDYSAKLDEFNKTQDKSNKLLDLKLTNMELEGASYEDLYQEQKKHYEMQLLEIQGTKAQIKAELDLMIRRANAAKNTSKYVKKHKEEYDELKKQLEQWEAEETSMQTTLAKLELSHKKHAESAKNSNKDIKKSTEDLAKTIASNAKKSVDNITKAGNDAYNNHKKTLEAITGEYDKALKDIGTLSKSIKITPLDAKQIISESLSEQIDREVERLKRKFSTLIKEGKATEKDLNKEILDYKLPLEAIKATLDADAESLVSHEKAVITESTNKAIEEAKKNGNKKLENLKKDFEKKVAAANAETDAKMQEAASKNATGELTSDQKKYFANERQKAVKILKEEFDTAANEAIKATEEEVNRIKDAEVAGLADLGKKAKDALVDIDKVIFDETADSARKISENFQKNFAALKSIYEQGGLSYEQFTTLFNKYTEDYTESVKEFNNSIIEPRDKEIAQLAQGVKGYSDTVKEVLEDTAKEIDKIIAKEGPTFSISDIELQLDGLDEALGKLDPQMKTFVEEYKKIMLKYATDMQEYSFDYQIPVNVQADTYNVLKEQLDKQFKGIEYFEQEHYKTRLYQSREYEAQLIKQAEIFSTDYGETFTARYKGEEEALTKEYEIQKKFIDEKIALLKQSLDSNIDLSPDQRKEIEGQITELQTESLERDKEYYTEKAKLHSEYVANIYDAVQMGLKATQDLMGNMADALKASADNMKDANGEYTAEGIKMLEMSANIQRANAVINAAAGIATVWATSASLGPIAGPIIAAIQTAAHIANLVTQLATIDKSLNDAKSGNKASAPSSASSIPEVTFTMESSEAKQTMLSDQTTTELQKDVQQNQKVYVVSSEITDNQNANKTTVTNATF